MSSLLALDVRESKLTGSVSGDEMPESAPANLSVSVSLATPLKRSVITENVDIAPADILSLKQVGGGTLNRDVKKEMQLETVEIVKNIAQEYVAIFPLPTTVTPVGNASVTETTRAAMDERKIQFLHHLSVSGVYHRLKEKLKPSIQRVARGHYGPRNRSLGESGSVVPAAGYTEESSIPMDTLISELYILLVKECNSVLNVLYKTTVTDRDLKDIEQLSAVNDEIETPFQKFKRILNIATDAEADGRHIEAEQVHLERIQLIDQELSLKSDSQNPYQAFFSLLNIFSESLVHCKLLLVVIIASPLTSKTL
jgi:hypothetical protein